ncbi:MAG: thioredoxin family protein [Cytophagaceae bacterium]
MKKSLILTAALVFSVMIMALTPKDDKEETRKKKDPVIKWMSFAEASKLNQKHPKKMFIDVFTSWCGWCVQMDKTTFKDPNVSKYLNDKYYAVKLNAESDAMISYKGKEMSERDLAKQIFRATGYPTTVYLDQEQNLLQPIPGYLEAEMLNKILHFYGEDSYKTMSWEQFEANYNNPQ